METDIYQEGEKSKIKRVLMGSHLINPLLITVDNRPLTQEELHNCECSWTNDDTDQHTRRVTFINNNKDMYQGSSKVQGNMSKTMLVLHSKKTNKVQLIEVSECRLGRVLEKPSTQTNYDNEEMQTTYEENRSKLLKAFGSKKSNRVSDIGSKMRINANMMSSQIKHTTADVKVDVKELEQADASVDTCLPPCHRDATNAAGVYLLKDFLTQLEMDSMEDEAEVVNALMPFNEVESGYSKFFIDALDRLQNKVSLERIKILLFVEALLRFIRLPNRIKKKDLLEKVCPFSSVVAKKIFENFTVNSTEGRIRNVTMDDKVVIHIIVLILIGCEFSCNTDELSKYLPKFSVMKIGQIARALSLSTRDKITWFLKLPLPAPRSVFMRRRT